MGKRTERNNPLQMLAGIIRRAQNKLAGQASRSVNLSLMLRNWLIGAHISEHEPHVADGATYGDQVPTPMAAQLSDVSNSHRRQLYRYLCFYRTDPQIVPTLSPQFQVFTK